VSDKFVDHSDERKSWTRAGLVRSKTIAPGIAVASAEVQSEIARRESRRKK
jgi:hypothetical protein